jgi:type I restriction enzyme S subunit
MASVSEEGEVDLSQERRISEVWTGFTYFRENDVVFAKITPCMENGKGAIMKKLRNEIGFGTTEFHVLRPLRNITTPEWLYHLTMQKSFRKEAEKNMTGSAGQKRVPTDFFTKYAVVPPSWKTQREFSEIVKKAGWLKLKYQASLHELENLYGALSQRAFRGELQ